MVQWALCLGSRALRGSTGALGVCGVLPGAKRTMVDGPAWCSVRSILSCVFRDSIFHVYGLALTREGQSLLRAECSSWQIGQHATEEGQQRRIGLRLPPLGPEGLGQRWSVFVCASELKGQTGSKLGQRWEMWLNFQHFIYWEFLKEQNICCTLRFREKRLNERRWMRASGRATETTTEVADF